MISNPNVIQGWILMHFRLDISASSRRQFDLHLQPEKCESLNFLVRDYPHLWPVNIWEHSYYQIQISNPFSGMNLSRAYTIIHLVKITLLRSYCLFANPVLSHCVRLNIYWKIFSAPSAEAPKIKYIKSTEHISPFKRAKEFVSYENLFDYCGFGFGMRDITLCSSDVSLRFW